MSDNGSDLEDWANQDKLDMGLGKKYKGKKNKNYHNHQMMPFQMMPVHSAPTGQVVPFHTAPMQPYQPQVIYVQGANHQHQQHNKKNKFYGKFKKAMVSIIKENPVSDTGAGTQSPNDNMQKILYILQNKEINIKSKVEFMVLAGAREARKHGLTRDKNPKKIELQVTDEYLQEFKKNTLFLIQKINRTQYITEKTLENFRKMAENNTFRLLRQSLGNAAKNQGFTIKFINKLTPRSGTARASATLPRSEMVANLEDSEIPMGRVY